MFVICHLFFEFVNDKIVFVSLKEITRQSNKAIIYPEII